MTDPVTVVGETETAWPKTTEFQNHHMDSTRWNRFRFRDDDIVIGTWAKSGTTWLQQIVGQFVFDGAEGVPVMELGPWLEYRILPEQKLHEMLEAQTHRRFLKTHLDANTLRTAPGVRYIYCARDGRDALWSWFEHHHAYTDVAYAALNETPGLVGDPFPRPGDDLVRYFHAWLDGDGYPAWPFFSNIRSWWELRDHPQVLLLHFNDLKADLDGQMRRIGEYLGFNIDESLFPEMVRHCSFDYMKMHADTLNSRLGKMFAGGGKSLINKGVNDRWRDTLSAADIEKYNARVAAELSPECAHWLAHGADG